MFAALNQRLERTSLIAEAAADNSAQTLDLLSFVDATRFESYYLELVGLTATADGETFSLQASDDGGATWLAADYVSRFHYTNNTNVLPFTGDAAKWTIHPYTINANAPIDVIFYLNDWSSASIIKTISIMAGPVSTASVGYSFGGAGYHNDVGALDSLRLTAANGNIVSGKMRVWGNRR